MADLDRIIQSLYTAAAEDDWQLFRPHALEMLCHWLGATSAAWHTHSASTLPGEFTEYPGPSGISREQMLALQFPGNVREIRFEPLTAPLAGNAGNAPEHGYAVHYAHRGGGDLISTVLLRFTRGKVMHKPEEIHRAIGHMIEASTLSLNFFIQRDEWLHSLGRNNRGAAAMIDEHGAIYVASKRFDEILTAELGERDSHALPCQPPPEALALNGGFVFGDLHFRLSKQGSLYMVYVRKSLPLDGLSPREQQIARALANGKTFKSVARQYTIAISTVANHASRIYKKLGIFRREELVDLLRRPEKATPAKDA